MLPNNYKNERVVIKDCDYPQYNGKTTLITDVDYHSTFGNIFKTEFKTEGNLPYWILETQIHYIKRFKGCLTQYQSKDGKSITKHILDDENGLLTVVGQFDIYEKIYSK